MEPYQFWMTWIVQVVAAIVTLAAVLVALFGQGLFNRWWPPKLNLSISSPEGDATPVTLQWVEPQDPLRTLRQRQEEGRYYRLCVQNDRRWAKATDVQVLLLRILEPDASGVFGPTWVGSIPLQWQHQSIYPALRTVGPPAEADLFSLVKGKGLYLQAMVPAQNLRTHWAGEAHMQFEVRVTSAEADSDAETIQVDWDGGWDSGVVEMKRHLVIRKV